MQRRIKERIKEALSGVSDLTEKKVEEIVQRIVSDSRRTISLDAFDKVKKSIFVITQNNKDTVGRGIGIFISPTLAVTADYVLDEVDDKVNILAVWPAGVEELTLTVKVRNSAFGYALLTCPGEHTHVDIWDGDYNELVDNLECLALCTCLLPFRAEPGGRFTTGVAVIPAHGLALTEHDHYLVYGPSMSLGGSGSALLTHGGQLIGMHAVGMSHLQKRKEMEQEDQPGDITEAASPVINAINSHKSAHLAVLAPTFKSI